MWPGTNRSRVELRNRNCKFKFNLGKTNFDIFGAPLQKDRKLRPTAAPNCFTGLCELGYRMKVFACVLQGDSWGAD